MFTTFNLGPEIKLPLKLYLKANALVKYLFHVAITH
jgi:hypothetical protein